MPKDIKTMKYYDGFSSSYDRQRLHGYFEFVNSVELDTLLPYAKGKNALEIGCGTGIIQKEASSQGHVVGIDLSRKMLSHCTGKGLSCAQANSVMLPFKENSFGCVYSFKVLPHVKDIESAIAEIDRVAKSGSPILLEFYNPYSIKRLIALASTPKIFTRHDSLARIKSMIPGTWRVEKTASARIVTPLAFLFNARGISRIVKAVEKALGKTPLHRFGSYFIVVCRKEGK